MAPSDISVFFYDNLALNNYTDRFGSGKWRSKMKSRRPVLLSVSRSAFPAEIVCDPSKRGQIAAPKVLFGEFSRYAIAPIHTRFGDVVWFVWDAEKELDDTHMADVIRQESSFVKAVEGLW